MGPEALLDAASLLADPARHATMSAAARGLARAGAADAVADLVLAVAGGSPLPGAAEIDALARGSAA